MAVVPPQRKAFVSQCSSGSAAPQPSRSCVARVRHGHRLRLHFQFTFFPTSHEQPSCRREQFFRAKYNSNVTLHCLQFVRGPSKCGRTTILSEPFTLCIANPNKGLSTAESSLVIWTNFREQPWLNYSPEFPRRPTLEIEFAGEHLVSIYDHPCYQTSYLTTQKLGLQVLEDKL